MNAIKILSLPARRSSKGRQAQMEVGGTTWIRWRWVIPHAGVRRVIRPVRPVSPLLLLAEFPEVAVEVWRDQP